MFLRDELHTLTGSYALDALETPERKRFERHLGRCPSCTAEVRGLRETAARLAQAAAVQPPASLHERVLAAAGRTRQLPVSAGQSRRRRCRARTPRLTFAVAVAVAVVSKAAELILAFTRATASSRLKTAQTRARSVAAVLAAPDAPHRRRDHPRRRHSHRHGARAGKRDRLASKLIHGAFEPAVKGH
jgi:anti-sigma factor RsiW